MTYGAGQAGRDGAAWLLHCAATQELQMRRRSGRQQQQAEARRRWILAGCSTRRLVPSTAAPGCLGRCLGGRLGGQGLTAAPRRCSAAAVSARCVPALRLCGWRFEDRDVFRDQDAQQSEQGSAGENGANSHSCVACCVSPLHPWTPRLVAAPDHVFALPTSFKVISHPSGTLPRPVPAPSLKWLLQLQSSSSWKTRVQRADAARNTCLQHFLGASVVSFVINRASAIVQASPIEALNSEGIASCRALFLSLLARHSAVVAR